MPNEGIPIPLLTVSSHPINQLSAQLLLSQLHQQHGRTHGHVACGAVSSWACSPAHVAKQGLPVGKGRQGLRYADKGISRNNNKERKQGGRERKH